MKIRSLFILVSILFLMGNNLYGQDYYMYINGNKHYYKVSPDKILVHYAENIHDSTEIKNSLQKLSVKSMKINNIYHEFALVDFGNISKEKIINMVEQWNISEKGIFTSPVISGEDGFEMSFIPNQILVRIKQESDYSLLTQKVQSYHVKEIKPCDFDKKTYLITLSDVQKKNSLQVANELYETGLFDYAEPNIFHFVKRMTNDTHYQQQWALHSNTAGIKATQAWTITTGNPNVRVAILDSGVDLGHPDLAGNLLQ